MIVKIKITHIFGLKTRHQRFLHEASQTVLDDGQEIISQKRNDRFIRLINSEKRFDIFGKGSDGMKLDIQRFVKDCILQKLVGLKSVV